MSLFKKSDQKQRGPSGPVLFLRSSKCSFFTLLIAQSCSAFGLGLLRNAVPSALFASRTNSLQRVSLRETALLRALITRKLVLRAARVKASAKKLRFFAEAPSPLTLRASKLRATLKACLHEGCSGTPKELCFFETWRGFASLLNTSYFGVARVIVRYNPFGIGTASLFPSCSMVLAPLEQFRRSLLRSLRSLRSSLLNTSEQRAPSKLGAGEAFEEGFAAPYRHSSTNASHSNWNAAPEKGAWSKLQAC